MARSISLDQLIALNEEMAALVRAGAPLERGLANLGRDMGGRLGSLATEVGNRLERGEPLEKVLADPNIAFPPLYRAVVEAGLRSGNLAAALEGLATTTRRTRELQRLVGMALIYPVLVVALAVMLFAVVAHYAAPALADAHRYWNLPEAGYLRMVADWGARPWLWAPWIPLALLIAGVIWWRRSRRATRLQVSGRVRGGAWRPTLARLAKASRMASFAETLRLLIEHRVPLPNALLLAGQASGDQRLEEDARRLAEHLERGQFGFPTVAGVTGLPPLLAWLLVGPAPEEQLVSALERLGRVYRHDALRMMQWFSVYLPLLLTGVVGGLVTLLYTVAVLGPVFRLLHVLGQP